MSGWQTAVEQIDLLKRTNTLFLQGLMQMAQRSGEISENSISGAKIYAMQSTGYSGIELPDPKSSLPDSSSDDYIGEIERMTEAMQQIAQHAPEQMQEGYLLKKPFAQLLKDGPQNTSEQKLLEEVATFLEPHQIEDAIRSKKDLFQVRDMVVNGMVHAHVREVTQSRENVIVQKAMQAEQMQGVLSGLAGASVVEEVQLNEITVQAGLQQAEREQGMNLER